MVDMAYLLFLIYNEVQPTLSIYTFVNIPYKIPKGYHGKIYPNQSMSSKLYRFFPWENMVVPTVPSGDDDSQLLEFLGCLELLPT